MYVGILDLLTTFRLSIPVVLLQFATREYRDYSSCCIVKQKLLKLYLTSKNVCKRLCFVFLVITNKY